MTVEIAPVPQGEKPAMWAMYQAYAGELAPMVNVEPVNGVYCDPRFDLYWIERTRWPYWAMSSGERAGFAMVHVDPEFGGMRMGEFYIRPEFRRAGIGHAFANTLLARHPGSWRIRQISGNTAAVAFWRRVAERFGYTEDRFIDKGFARVEQRFSVV